MKFKVKVVMIDLDGTMIHTSPEIARAANNMLLGMGKTELEAQQIEAYIGEGALMLIKRCLTAQSNNELDLIALEPSVNALEKAQQLFFVHYAKIVAESKPYSGVLGAVQALKAAGYKLACVTNKPESFTLPLLQASGLLQYFELVVSGDTLQKKKPEPDQIFHVCAKFDVSVSEALLIGDSKTDIAAARTAGCYVFAVPYGYNRGCKIESDSVDALINHLSEALALIH